MVMPVKHAAYVVVLFWFILLFSTQNVIIHDEFFSCVR